MDRTSAANNVNIGGGRRGYRDRNLGAGLRGTALVAADRNAIQEEILKVIEDAGLTPNASDWTQLREACRILFGGGGTLAANGWQRLPGGLLMQWGAISATTGVADPITFPLAFPQAVYSVTLTERGASGWVPQAVTIFGHANATLTGFNLYARIINPVAGTSTPNVGAGDAHYIALGR